MAVLVTGGAGYIGSHLVWALLDSGEDVVVIDDLSSGFQHAVAPQATFCRGDIADRQLLGELLARHAVDAIIHCAGSVVVPDSVERPLAYYENNTCKSRILIEQAVAAGVAHFIFSSTAAVYAPGGEGPLDETARLGPQSPYGMSKWMTELMLRDAANAHSMSYGILRYFNVAGADPAKRAGQSTRGATHLVKVVCEAVTGKRDKIEIFGTDWDTPDGTAIRDFVHVSDLAQAHVITLRHLRRSGVSLTANCGYGHGYSVREVIEAAQRVSGKSVPVVCSARRQGDVACVVADAAFIRRELEWRPQFDRLDLILSHGLAWEHGC